MLKEIIAPVLQYTVKEYQTHTVSEIIGYINANSIADDVPVDDLPAHINSDGTELASPTEKRVFFDIHFTAKNPKLSSKDVFVMLHIDFEVQNDYEPSNPSYPITKRAIYYAARELSAQLGVVTGNTNYDDLEKVYSIWICNEKIPEGLKNSITRYHMEKEDLMGVFTTNFDTINKYVDVENNKEVKEVLKTMCGLGESLELRGIEKGIEKGKLIQLIELVLFGDLTEEKASQKAGMTLEAFKKEMQNATIVPA